MCDYHDKGSLHPFGSKTAIEKNESAARFIFAPKVRPFCKYSCVDTSEKTLYTNEYDKVIFETHGPKQSGESSLWWIQNN